MGKRKANVFTATESVDSWLGASCSRPEHVEPGVEETVQLGTDLNPVIPVRPNQPTAGLLGTNPVNRLPSLLTTDPGCGLVGGSSEVLVADVASPPHTSQEGIHASSTSEELDPRTEAAVEALWALLTKLGYEPL